MELPLSDLKAMRDIAKEVYLQTFDVPSNELEDDRIKRITKMNEWKRLHDYACVEISKILVNYLK